MSSLRPLVKRGRYLRGAADLARPAYRSLRTRWLRLRHPYGTFVTGNGVRIYVDVHSPTYAWYDADAPNLAFDQRVIRGALAQSEGNVFIDIGAHFGFFSAYVAGLTRHSGSAMRILGFEPDRRNVRCLRHTMSTYGDVDVTIFPVAVSAADANVFLYRSSDSPCLHTYPDETTVAEYSVKTVRLDTAVDATLLARDRVALIKIDVDGAEPSVFRGAEMVLREHRPLVFTELSPKHLRRSGTDPRRFFADLCSRFRTYWVRYEPESIVEVHADDFDQIEASIDVITDLLLSDRVLDVARF